MLPASPESARAVGLHRQKPRERRRETHVSRNRAVVLHFEPEGLVLYSLAFMIPTGTSCCTSVAPLAHHWLLPRLRYSPRPSDFPGKWPAPLGRRGSSRPCRQSG